MKITYDDKGLHIKKVFRSREISYSDVKSVIVSNEEYTFTTKTGEVLKNTRQFGSNYAPLYEAIKKYNIYFKSENDLNTLEKVYSGEEVNEKIVQTQSFIKKYADKFIREKLGPEYGFDSVNIDDVEWIEMYFRLLKNGEVVQDIPEAAKYEPDDKGLYAFDVFTLAFLVEWDGYGRYGVVEEVESREECEAYIVQPLKHLLQYYTK